MATEVLEGPRDDGFVIALHGAWGSGKTSVLNMVREDIGDQAAMVLFNPWLFSDAEQLVDRFFSEVNAQLEGDQGLSSVRGLFNEYREVVSPLVPIVFGRFGAIAAALTEGASKRKQRRRASARESYERLKAALRKADRQIVVVIDDIDRLTPHEIREVIRLIKAVADLPNVTYLLAFARPRVEAALGLGEEEGAEYLEKIVQLSHTVPPIPAAVLRQLALDALGETLDGFELDHLDRSSWAVIFQSGIAPMLSTVRDAYRLANAAPAIATLVGDEVAIQDLLGLEALRLFAPDFHALLPQMVDIVGGGERLDVRDSHVIRDEHAGRVGEWLGLVAEPRRTQVKELMRALFPAAGHLLGGSRYSGMSREWRRNRRVADTNVLAAYVHHTFSEGETATAQVVRIVQSLGREDRLTELLNEVPDDQLPSLLDRVRDYVDEFAPEEMETAARVFLGLLWRMPEEREFFQMPPEWGVHFTVEAFLRALPDEQREPVTDRLFRDSPSLSQRLRVLNWFGAFPDREDRRPEREFLSEETTRTLVRELSCAVLESETAQIADEPFLVRLMAMTLDLDETSAREAIALRAEDDHFFLRLLQGCVRSGRSGGGDGVVRRIVAFDWDGLVKLVGESVARERIEHVGTYLASPELADDEDEAIRLAQIYAEGKGPTGDNWLQADDLSVSE